MERKTTAFKKLFFLILLVLGTISTNAQVAYVDQNATGTGDGASWVNAFTDLQAAIDAAATVATAVNPIQVWVKADTYYPTLSTDRTIAFEIKNAVELYGGFDGTETLLSQRDFEGNPTILSGDIGTSSDNTDNTYAIVYAGNSVSNYTLLDGFHVTGASTLNEGAGAVAYGGISMIGSAAKLEVKNCSIYGNDAGLGSAITTVVSSNASAILIVAFSKVYNNSRSITGANVIWTTRDLEIYNSLIYDNGGQNALLRQIGNVILSGVTFFNNSGSAYFQNQPSNTSAQIYNSIFWKSGLFIEAAALATTAADNNLVEGGFGLGTVVDADPQFFDESTFDLRITHCSPAVNVGSNFDVYSSSSLDFGGDPRIFGSNVDLGAYESQITPLILFTAQVDNALCNGEASGQISVSGAGGTGGSLTYSIDGTNFVSSGTFSNLVAGVYTVYLKDAICTYSEMFAVTESPAINIDLSVTMGATSNNLEVTTSGGTGVLQYSLDGISYQSASTFPMTTSGQYQVYVKDANNCVVTKSAYFSNEGNRILFVDKGATGAGDGGSWADAFTDLQSAIDDATTATSTAFSANVWVKAGTYYPTISQAGTDRTVSFAMKENVQMYGGFLGTETALGQRDWMANETILSGNIGDPTDSTDNSVNVIHNDYIGSTALSKATVLDGFIVERGYMDAGALTDGGAGMKNSYASPTVRNTTFRYNVNAYLPTAPGFTGGPGSVSYNGVGGAVRNNLGSIPDFISCVFHHNIANQGGAIAYFELSNAATGGTANISNCLFYENEAVTSASAFYGANTFNINFFNNTFADNSETGAGAATAGDFLFYSGALLYRLPATVLLMYNNVFWGNTNPRDNYQLWLRFPSSNFLFRSNAVEGGQNGFKPDDNGSLVTSTNLYDFDPMFVDPSVDDYAINYCSPAVDAGTSANLPADLTVDLIGNPRIFNEVDLGAFEVRDETPYVVSSQVNNVTCFAGTDGQITLTATGTFTPISYSFDGTTFGATNIFTGLTAGVYTIYLKDANGCIDSTEFEVMEPNILSIAAAVTQQVSCNGGSDGIISGSVTGGTAPYEISFNEGATFVTAPFASTFEITGLDADDPYTLTVRDDNMCLFTQTPDVEVTEPTVISGSVTVSDVLCNGESTGEISVTASGGTGSYTYSIDAVNFQTSSVFSNLAAGNYDITIQDANTCSITLSETVGQPSALSSIAVSAIQITCNGANDGSFNFGGTGGISPYQYSLDGTNFQSSPLWENQSAGNYTITIMDANGCATTANWIVTEPDELAAVLTETGTSSCGLSDGSVLVIPSGGTGPYSFVLDGGAPQTGSTTTFTGLVADSYSIVVQDSKGCQITVDGAIADPVTSTVTAAITDVLCNGEATGSINLTVSGGTGPIEYSVDGSTFQTSSVFDDLTAGNYSITVKEANGCSQSVSVTISEPNAISTTLLGTNLTCKADGSGTISITSSGGTGTLQYSLDGTNFQATSSFSDLDAGDYTVSIKDENGCIITENISLTEPDAIAATSSTTDASCMGSADGTITIAASGGTGVLLFSLDGSASQSSNVFSGVNPGTYNITVTDSEGCVLTLDNVVVGSTVTITPSATVTDVTCNGESTGSLSLSASGGTAPYEYSLDGTTFQSTVDFVDLGEDSYTVTAKDANGCLGSALAIITEPDALAISVIQSDGDFAITASGGTAPYEYSSDGTTFQTGSAFTDLDPGAYTFRIMDANGCEVTSSSFTIVLGLNKVENEIKIYPNPTEDYFILENQDVKHIEIYDMNAKRTLLIRSGDKVDVRNLGSGLYMILMKDAEGALLSTNRLIKR